jgi:ferritin
VATDNRFLTLLRTQVGVHACASHQYLAVAIYYDSQKLPQLAKHFYRLSGNERAHTMALIRHLSDRSITPPIPAVAEPAGVFADQIAPLTLATVVAEKVNDSVTDLAESARDERDYVGMELVQSLLVAQAAEASDLRSLRRIANRIGGGVLDLERHLWHAVSAAA